MKIVIGCIYVAEPTTKHISSRVTLSSYRTKFSELETRIQVFFELVAWLKLDEQRALQAVVNKMSRSNVFMYLLAD